MNKRLLAAPLLAAALCTLATGCGTTKQEESSMPLTSPSAAVSPNPTQSGFAGGGTGAVGNDTVTLESPQKLRITYQQGTPNSITCVSSAEQLKAYGLYGSETLAAYDDSFFDSKALVLVKYTVNSGSTQLSLGSATQVNDMVSVHLDAQSSGMGTADMATWLLWAEVDKSLSGCQWVLDSPGNATTGVTH